VKERASDLHLEPFENELRVRFRIDNVLYEPIKPLPKALQASIVSRIKIMGRLNIAEKRLPQDGRIRLKIAGRDYDVRLSTLPVAYGERVVMRLLPRTQELLDLTTLGFDEQQLATMNKLITRPNGIVLVTGPTGSGKTTTLYGALARINATDKNIITIEDPVEIQLAGVGQIEVNAKVGPHVRERAALDPAPGPERDPDRRDPRPRDRGDRDPGLAHRPPRVLDAAHQRRAERDHAPRRHGRRAVPGRLVAGRGARAALVRVLCADCKVPYEATTEELASSASRPDARCACTGPRAARAATTPAIAAASASSS
jgi:general secretion pathway protein E